ncbi:helix-turn-helix domain-containing protein [Halomonas litopenaei]|nr:helix-turn-helix domain-containing protein [Halomonas litopenaei]
MLGSISLLDLRLDRHQARFAAGMSMPSAASSLFTPRLMLLPLCKFYPPMVANMTVRVALNGEERERLEKTFKHTADRRLRERCQAARGRRRRQIAEDLGVHRTSVHRWLQAYQAAGLAGLEIHWAPGQTPRIPRLSWPRRSRPGCREDRPAAVWSGRTGRMRSWPLSCTVATGSR